MLAKTVNDNAKNQTPRDGLGFFASKLAPTKVTGRCPCLAGHLDPTVGASLLAKTVNDNAENQTPRSGPGFFASKLAPTKVTDQCPCLAGHLDPTVGASLLAKTVNDNAKNQPPPRRSRVFREQARSYKSYRSVPMPSGAPRPHCRSELAREDRQR